MIPYTLGNRAAWPVRACECLNFVYTHFIAKYTQKTYLTLIYVQNMYYLWCERLRCLLWCVLIYMSAVSLFPQQWFVLRYKKMSLVFTLCCYYHTTVHDFICSGPFFVTNLRFMFQSRFD